MKKISQTISKNSELISAELEKILGEYDEDYKIIFDSMNYSTLGAGKRIRPTITLEFAAMLGADQKAALPMACAVEMIHTYSLIHDDLPCMDNDDYRRGKPTNHKVFGEANALLAGDGLLTHAFNVIANNPYTSPEQSLKAVRILSENAGVFGMIGGQQLDMLGENKKLTEEKLIKMHSLKTGALITASALLGCICANGSEKDFESAREYSKNIGLAFQIIDDILDDGEEENKTTFLDFYSLEEANEYAKTLTNNAILAIKEYKNNQTLTELALYLSDRKR